MSFPEDVCRDSRDSETLHEENQDDSEISYPEGGRAAWIVAIGSWCSMTAGLGIVNSVGVFQAYLILLVERFRVSTVTGNILWEGHVFTGGQSGKLERTNGKESV